MTQNVDPAVLEIAMAIEGPWSEKHLDKETLATLRNHRWQRLAGSDKAIRIMQAQSVLRTQMLNARACQVPPTLEDRG